jgi:hypothetical protein
MRAFRTLIHHCLSLRFEYSLRPPSLSSFRHAPPNTTLLLRDLQIVASPLHIALWPFKTNRPAVPTPSAIDLTARFTCPALNTVGPSRFEAFVFPKPLPSPYRYFARTFVQSLFHFLQTDQPPARTPHVVIQYTKGQ